MGTKTEDLPREPHHNSALFRDVLVWKKLLVCRKYTAGVLTAV